MKTLTKYTSFKAIGLFVLALAVVIVSAGPASAAGTNSKAASTKAHATAIFAAGCFWGTEYMFRNINGVVSTTVGYDGGFVEHPTYKQVSTGKTGHAESMKIVYDPSKVSYETLARRFFEIHDPTQVNRQGPDIGTQYRSAVFYENASQKTTAEKLIGLLKAKGLKVATTLEPATKFWPAENSHQDYYAKNGHTPYCHHYKKLF